MIPCEHVCGAVLDKNFNEISPVIPVFPEGIVFLCQFHVVAYFRKAEKSGKYGRFSSGNDARLDTTIEDLTVTRSDNEDQWMKLDMLNVTADRDL